MSTAITYTATIIGIEARIIEVEADISIGMGSFNIVGLPDGTIRESKERVMSALNNSAGGFPIRKVVVNLAPADVKKIGSGFDLPIALAILEAAGRIPSQCLRSYLIIGELSLEGKIKPVEGVLAVALAAKKAGFKSLIVPKENARAACLAEGLEILTASDINETALHFRDERLLSSYQKTKPEKNESQGGENPDFADVRGQPAAKRALEIAAAGKHNALFSGPPGAGKSMLAKRTPGILPPLSIDEALEVTKIHSIAGILSKNHQLMETRPFRAPHHSISNAGLIGGGTYPKPGEISLAHHGALFLDEIAEFPRTILDLLRQPLEDKKVTISRASLSLTFPCDYILLAAMNPCPCGYLGSSLKDCVCSAAAVIRYRSRLSGPLMDRIDLQIEMSPLSYEEINFSAKGENSRDIRSRVLSSRSVQRERFKDRADGYNGNMSRREIERHCVLNGEGHALLSHILKRFNLSARGHDSILKVSRTIADLNGSESIETSHLAEAVNYRCLDKELNF